KSRAAARSFLPRAAKLLQSAAEILEQIAVGGLGDVDGLAGTSFSPQPPAQLVAGGSHVTSLALDPHSVLSPALRDSDWLSEEVRDGRPSRKRRRRRINYGNLCPPFTSASIGLSWGHRCLLLRRELWWGGSRFLWRLLDLLFCYVLLRHLRI